jgi:hypothetical protein
MNMKKDLVLGNDTDFIEITAMAQILHSFYNGVESVIILFLKSIKEKIPNDSKWHKTVFEIAFGSNSKNIRILREDIKIQLEDYMYFRNNAKRLIR